MSAVLTAQELEVDVLITDELTGVITGLSRSERARRRRDGRMMTAVRVGPMSIRYRLSEAQALRDALVSGVDDDGLRALTRYGYRTRKESRPLLFKEFLERREASA